MGNGSMDDNNNRNNESSRSSLISADMRDSLVLATKLIAVMMVVIILSFGLIACSALFIWLCFIYPQSTTDFLRFLVPSGISAIVICYGKKVLSVILNGNGKKLIDKDHK